MWTFFTQSDSIRPLILPDSVQKERLAETIDKVTNLDPGQFLMDMASQAVWIVLKVVAALLIYFIGRWIVRRIVRLLDKAMERRNVDTSLRSFLRNLIQVVFTLLILLVVVETLGVNVTSIIAIFSAATLAIGMAMSGTAQNLAGGAMIMLMRPYRVGDFITAQGQSGTVVEIKIFSTVITTADNRTIYIPNNTISTSIIDNSTAAELRRVDWSFGISYGDKMADVRRVVLDILVADPRVLTDPAPAVFITALNDNSVNISARGWVCTADYWDVFFEINEKIYTRLPEKGINFPFPQIDVHVKQE